MTLEADIRTKVLDMVVKHVVKNGWSQWPIENDGTVCPSSNYVWQHVRVPAEQLMADLKDNGHWAMIHTKSRLFRSYQYIEVWRATRQVLRARIVMMRALLFSPPQHSIPLRFVSLSSRFQSGRTAVTCP